MLNPIVARLEAVKVNRTGVQERNGKPVWIKERLSCMLPLLATTNLFFALAGHPARTFVHRRDWRAWEIASFEGLHGPEGFKAWLEGWFGVATAALPGDNMTAALDTGRLTPAMAHAAGVELRRAHGWPCAAFGGSGWSHGDAHVGNFLYDPVSGRARIIDFEVRHRLDVEATIRHADDVLAFLLDLVGRIHREGWAACARSFLDGYGDPRVATLALNGLPIPRFGPAKLWWKVRTGFLAGAEYARRVAELLKDY